MKLSSFTNGRDNNFNIIRILAALAVLVSHSFILTGIGAEPIKAVTGITLGGMAVDVFFITSGFLVSASLLTRRSIPEYLCARALRIFPAMLVVTGLTVFCLGVCFTDIPLLSYFTAPATYKYLFKNSTLIAGVVFHLPGVFEHNPLKGEVNGPIWSIPFELRFYALLAFIWVILRAARENRSRLFEFTVVSFAILSGACHFIGHFCFS